MSSSKTSLKRALYTIVLVAVILFAAQPQDKGNFKEARKAAPSKSQADQPAGGGFRAFIDPATGKLRDAEPGEAAALQSQTRLLVAGASSPAAVSLPKGGVGIRLGESQMVYSVARIGPDGKVVIGCVTGREQAEAVLGTPVAKEALDVK